MLLSATRMVTIHSYGDCTWPKRKKKERKEKTIQTHYLYFKNALKTKGGRRAPKKNSARAKKEKRQKHAKKKGCKKKETKKLTIRAAGDGERASPAFCCGAGKGVLGAFADGGAQFP